MSDIANNIAEGLRWLLTIIAIIGFLLGSAATLAAIYVTTHTEVCK